MPSLNKPEWEIVRFSDDVIRTSVPLPIHWFVKNPEPNPKPDLGTGEPT